MRADIKGVAMFLNSKDLDATLWTDYRRINRIKKWSSFEDDVFHKFASYVDKLLKSENAYLYLVNDVDMNNKSKALTPLLKEYTSKHKLRNFREVFKRFYKSIDVKFYHKDNQINKRYIIKNHLDTFIEFLKQ